MVISNMVKKKTKGERITITISPNIKEVMEQIRDLSGTSLSRQISELLEAMEPVLRQSVQTMQLVKKLEGAPKEELKKRLEDMEGVLSGKAKEVESLLDDVSDQLDLFFHE